MQRKKIFSIITIVCFASVIFIPIGLVLMAYFTDWPRKRKIITGAVMTVLYVTIILVITNLKPSVNSSGISLPGSYNKGVTEFDSGKENLSKSKNKEFIAGQGEYPADDEDLEDIELPSTIKKHNRKKNTRWVFPLIFFLVMLAIIIIQNIKSSMNKEGYDNPYVDVTRYKLPLTDDSKLPMVHFLRINLQRGETILYATQTVQKDNEGDFVITDKRVCIYNRETTVSYKLKEITLASSVSNSVMMVASGSEKNYIFLPENQMKYALGVIRYAYNKFSGKTTK